MSVATTAAAPPGDVLHPHLGVLRAVNLVLVRTDGRHRWYRVNGAALKPIHDWVSSFERTWNERLDRLDDLVAELKSQEKTP